MGGLKNGGLKMRGGGTMESENGQWRLKKGGWGLKWAVEPEDALNTSDVTG